MINKLCSICINTCKQDDTVRIARCPKFKKKPPEKKFLEMINELDNAEITARKTQKRVKEIIHDALSLNTHEASEDEEDIQ